MIATTANRLGYVKKSIRFGYDSGKMKSSDVTVIVNLRSQYQLSNKSLSNIQARTGLII